MKRTKSKRGRPKGEKTIVKRIHKAIEPQVDNLEEKYRRKLKRQISKFNALDVPKSKRGIYKEIAKPLNDLVNSLI